MQNKRFKYWGDDTGRILYRDLIPLLPLPYFPVDTFIEAPIYIQSQFSLTCCSCYGLINSFKQVLRLVL